MGRRADRRKAAAWERRLARFGEAGLSVSRFCVREGVSVGALQYWQRTFEDDGALIDEASSATPPRGLFAPVEVVSRQAVTIRFTGGAVMEISEGCEDLVTAAVRVLVGEDAAC
jgi:hypothetical protein